MKIRKFNEEISHTSKEVCVKYLEVKIEECRIGGGNPVNLESANDLAITLDGGSISDRGFGVGEDGWYEDNTLDMFKRLIDSMCEDEVNNHNVEDRL